MSTLPIRKEVNNAPTPWLDMIRDGIKTFEGHLNRPPFWPALTIGSQLIFYCQSNHQSSEGDDRVNEDGNGYELPVVVTDLRHFVDFGEAYRALGSQLVPDKVFTDRLEDRVQKVQGLYAQYFTEEDIRTYGVLCVGITPLSSSA